MVKQATKKKGAAAPRRRTAAPSKAQPPCDEIWIDATWHDDVWRQWSETDQDASTKTLSDRQIWVERDLGELMSKEHATICALRFAHRAAEGFWTVNYFLVDDTERLCQKLGHAISAMAQAETAFHAAYELYNDLSVRHTIIKASLHEQLITWPHLPLSNAWDLAMRYSLKMRSDLLNRLHHPLRLWPDVRPDLLHPRKRNTEQEREDSKAITNAQMYGIATDGIAIYKRLPTPTLVRCAPHLLIDGHTLAKAQQNSELAMITSDHISGLGTCIERLEARIGGALSNTTPPATKPAKPDCAAAAHAKEVLMVLHKEYEAYKRSMKKTKIKNHWYTQRKADGLEVFASDNPITAALEFGVGQRWWDQNGRDYMITKTGRDKFHEILALPEHE